MVKDYLSHNAFRAVAVILLLGLANLGTLATEDYEGSCIFHIELGHQKLQSFTLKSQNWFARSLVQSKEKDIETVQFLLKQQSPEKRIHLPDPDDRDGLLDWVREFKSLQPGYQPFLVFNNIEESEAVALVELHTMPRAVKDPQKQAQVLSFYQGKGLMTYDSSNSEEEYTGKYRVVKNGRASMARLCLLMAKQYSNDLPLMTDIIKGTAALIRTFRDYGFEMHPYNEKDSLQILLTDPLQGLPHIVMSYIALENSVRQAYKEAGFSLEENIVFKEFWPPEYNEKLRDDMVVVTQFVDEIPAIKRFSFKNYMIGFIT